MNREFTVITYMLVLLFVAMIGYMTYFQVVKSDEILSGPYNRRDQIYAQKVIRGSILADNLEPLAYTEVLENGVENRIYPYGNIFAHVIGYTGRGQAGLESSEVQYLLSSNHNVFKTITKQLQNGKSWGDDVYTTLNIPLQNAAYQALGEQVGAAVVMEAKTGKILALVSKPDFQPGMINETWEELSQNTNAPLLNRVTSGLYPPGSTFKPITALGYMRQFPNYEEYQWYCEGSLVSHNFGIHCYGYVAHGNEGIEESMAYSCNTSFANMALNMNLGDFNKLTKSLFFNEKIPYRGGMAMSRFSLEENASVGDIMTTSFGQGETRMTPLHLSLIMSGIANEGKVMKPYLVNRVMTKDQNMVHENSPEEYKQIMSAQEASQLTRYLKAVVDYGTGTELNYGTYSVAGKTGSAEYNDNPEDTHSWFSGFSNLEDPDIVVTVIVEGGGTGSRSALPVAKAIFDAYYQQ